MKPLSEIVLDLEHLRDRRAQAVAGHSAAVASIDVESDRATQLLHGAAIPLDLARIERARLVLDVDGDPRRSFSMAGWMTLADAMVQLATGGGKLRRYRLSVKNFDRFHSAREDLEYGSGHTHGHAVFSVGLRSEWRDVSLTTEQIEDGLYLLAAIRSRSLDEPATVAANRSAT